MSNNVPGPEFWNRVNAIINFSNDQCEAADPAEVSASTMYASARFNAFIVARSAGSAENMRQEKEKALEYFTEQYRRMMSENLDDFADNIEKYLGLDTK
jgi:hypothetical protein